MSEFQVMALDDVKFLICRFVALALITTVICYLLILILKFVYKLIVPVTAMVIIYISYINGGLLSSEGFKNSLDGFLLVFRALYTGVHVIWEAINSTLPQT